jgi:hypothetical protein
MYCTKTFFNQVLNIDRYYNKKIETAVEIIKNCSFTLQNTKNGIAISVQSIDTEDLENNNENKKHVLIALVQLLKLVYKYGNKYWSKEMLNENFDIELQDNSEYLLHLSSKQLDILCMQLDLPFSEKLPINAKDIIAELKNSNNLQLDEKPTEEEINQEKSKRDKEMVDKNTFNKFISEYNKTHSFLSKFSIYKILDPEPDITKFKNIYEIIRYASAHENSDVNTVCKKLNLIS